MSLTHHFYDWDHPFFDFNRLFDDAWHRRIGNRHDGTSKDVQHISSSSIRPKMDLHESKENEEMTAMIELPGTKKEDVSIDAHNNRLIISGKSSWWSDNDPDGYSVRERRIGKFYRTLPLPPGIESEDIKASMENGLLVVRFPRYSPEQDKRRVTIA